MATIGTRLRHGLNAFLREDQKRNSAYLDRVEPWYGASIDGPRHPDRPRMMFAANDKSIITAIYLRMAMDAAGVSLKHVRLDDKGRYLKDMDSLLNDCLTVEANPNQAATHFKLDMYLSMFIEGCIAIVPVDIEARGNSISFEDVTGFDVRTMQIGKIVKWFPTKVRVRIWRQEFGRHEEVTLPYSMVGILENPFYSVMNEPNSVLQRLIVALSRLDSIDEQAASGKLDLIVQLGYTVRGEDRQQEATKRIKNIEMQLSGSKYGVAYADATEKITQLNRPVENTVMKHVEYLTNLLFSMLGITPEIMNGTADEQAMLHYSNRTTKPIVTAAREAMHRAFLTKTARTQRQAIMEFINPFQMVPLSVMAEIADKFSRNEILTPNEIRQFLGIAPHDDPRADNLQNSNMPVDDLGIAAPGSKTPPAVPAANDPIGQLSQAVDDIFKDLDKTA